MVVSAEAVMTDYTCMKYAEMLLICCEWQRNSRVVRRAYSECFLRNRYPTHEIITYALNNLRVASSVWSRPTTNRRARCNVRGTPDEVLSFAFLNPQLSMTEISEKCGYTRHHVWYLLHVHGAHPYDRTLVQAFMLIELPRRFHYCNFTLNTLEIKPSFLCDILWAYESTFIGSGIVKMQMCITDH